ncbi:hypothetical protein AYX13_06417 [Cryptococcus neoformans]|nr:hypothetical protein AYX13_06417 [Cryptococcus neoformans var. grubii]
MGSSMPPPHVRAWYSYAFAAEVFSACALAIFLPITLEQMAREVGYYAPELTEICVINGSASDVVERVCKARILGVWIDTASFSMYVKSIAVACQAICIISIGPLADNAYWRKRLLLTFAYSGSLSGILFLLFPSLPYAWTPIVAAILNIGGNAAYSTSIVCSNAFLPGLAKEDVDVQKAWEEAAFEDLQGDVRDVHEDTDEESRRSVSREDEATHLLPERLIPAVRAISTQDLALSDPLTRLIEPCNAKKHYESLLSLTTSRLSSTGTAIGFFSGVSVLTLLLIPVMALGGSTFSMRLAIGLSGVWWALFTVPTCIGLPGGASGHGSDFNASQVKEAWLKVGKMVVPKQIRHLPNLYTFLLAWIFLSDGFHTTTYAAILYASSVLSMSAPKIIFIGILVQLAAVISSILVPRVQRRLSITSSKPVTNYKVLLAAVVAAAFIPVYTCVGLVLPFGGLRSEGEMYVLAVWFGLVFGPFLSYSRAVYAELIPPGHESTFFSLFSFTDKSASFIGPAAVGLISDLTGNIRYGFLFLLVMLVVPIPVLGRVGVERGRREAVEWAERAGKETSSERV